MGIAKRMLLVCMLSMNIMFGVATFLPTTVSAAGGCDKSSGFFALPTWYEYLEIGQKGDDPCAVIGPKNAAGEFDIEKAIPAIALAVIDILLRVVGLVTVGYVIYGGFRYMTSQGEPDATKKAQGTVINALIGMAIAIFATAMVNFIGSRL